MSSILKRLRRSMGTSKLEFTSTVSKNAPPTFVPDIVRQKKWILTDKEHVHYTAKHDPFANFIVYGVPEMIFDDWFKFVDKDGNEIMQDVQKRLKQLRFKKVATQCLVEARKHGKSYMYFNPSKEIPPDSEGYNVAEVRMFHERQCSVYEYDDMGNPKTMKLELLVGLAGGQETKVLYLPAKDFIFWYNREGESALEPIWDHLVYLRYLFHSMTWFGIKIGHGLFVAFTDAGFDDSILAKYQTYFEDVSSKRATVVDSSEVQDIKFVGPNTGATDFVEHILMVIKSLSVPTGISFELLMGAAAGAVTGSETNLKIGEQLEKRIKKFTEEVLRDSIKRFGYSNDDYEIEWIEKTAESDLDKSKIEQAHTQAQSTRMTYMTIDEVRELDKLPPLPDGRGDKLASEISSFNIGVEGLPNEQDPNNPEGENV